MDYATLHAEVDDRGQQTFSCLTAPVNQTCPQSGLVWLAAKQRIALDRRKSPSLSLSVFGTIASCVYRFRHLQLQVERKGQRVGGGIDTPLIMNRFPSFNSVGKPRKFCTPAIECEENAQPQNVISISLEQPPTCFSPRKQNIRMIHWSQRRLQFAFTL